MKKQMKAIAVICSAVLGLAACSSSGSSGTVNTGTTSKPSTPTNTSTTGSNTNTGTTTPSQPTTTTAKYEGKILTAQNSNGANAKAAALTSDSLDTIKIDGQNVVIKQQGISSGTFTKMSTNNGANNIVASDRALSYMRFGAYDNNLTYGSGGATYSTFALGSVTPAAQMPTTGKATYTGLSLTSNIGGGVWSEGTSSFNVDFGAKTVAGTVKDGASIGLNLSAKINGSSFSGTQNGITTTGHFFGPNAAEMGGVFNGAVVESTGSITNYMGSFGAKKQ